MWVCVQERDIGFSFSLTKHNILILELNGAVLIIANIFNSLEVFPTNIYIKNREVNDSGLVTEIGSPDLRHDQNVQQRIV